MGVSMALVLSALVIPVLGSDSSSNGYNPEPTDSLFCFDLKHNPAFAGGDVDNVCVASPEKCISLLKGLKGDCGKVISNPQQCFLTTLTGATLCAKNSMWHSEFPLKEQNNSDFKPRIPATVFFNSTAPLSLQPEYYSGTDTITYACIASPHIQNAMQTLDKPYITYQAAANSLPLAVTSKPAVIENIEMFVDDQWIANSIDGGLTMNIPGDAAGLYTQPSGLVFTLEGPSNISYSIMGTIKNTGTQFNPFKPGSFTGKTVLNESTTQLSACTYLKDLTVLKVFRKVGVASASRNKPVPPKHWFDVSTCYSTLNNCEDLSALQKPCSNCTDLEVTQAKCTLFSDTKCAPMRSMAPTTPPKKFTADGESTDVRNVDYAVIVFIVFIAVVGFVCLFSSVCNPKEPEQQQQSQSTGYSMMYWSDPSSKAKI